MWHCAPKLRPIANLVLKLTLVEKFFCQVL